MDTERQEQGSQTQSGTVDQQAALDLKLELQRMTVFTRTIRLALYAVAILGFGYLAYLTAMSLEGQETSVNVKIHLYNFGDALPWLAALIAFVWAFFENWMRRKEKQSAERRINFMQSVREKYESAAP